MKSNYPCLKESLNMKPLNLTEVTDYVEKNISSFHEKRIESLNSLKLSRILKRKNPYLFKAKHLLTADEVVKKIVEAHISSHEETIFGDWLEGLAIFINKRVYGGWKSGITGIDLEFDKDKIRYIVNIKSGPNWGNSSQKAKMSTDFKKAKRTLRTSNSQFHIIAVNGCCYGKDSQPDKGDHFKYCGQKFWGFISGSDNLYLDIIEPLGHNARQKNEAYMESYGKMVNKFVKEFINGYCTPDGAIDWAKLIYFNSGSGK